VTYDPNTGNFNVCHKIARRIPSGGQAPHLGALASEKHLCRTSRCNADDEEET
jgi:hypothetical protein